ncbi:MAG: rhomboid family intramembrane serine protease [Candidatus Eisenbacteria bacterium]
MIPAPADERPLPDPGRDAGRLPEPAGAEAPEWEPDFSPDPDEPARVELWSAVGDVAPWGSVLILFACGIVFAAQAARGEVGDSSALIAWGASVTGMTGLDAAWRLLASTFNHGGGMHLLLNTISLLMFGAAVEAIYARPSFWMIYAGGGALASAASLLVRAWRQGGASVSVGASGAIFALAGALLVAAFRLRGRLAPGRARALAAALLFLVVQSLAGGAAKHTTDNTAHAAGLIAGALIGLLVPLNTRLDADAVRLPPAGSAPVEVAPAPRRRGGAAAMLGGALAALALGAAFAFTLARGLAVP